MKGFITKLSLAQAKIPAFKSKISLASFCGGSSPEPAPLISFGKFCDISEVPKKGGTYEELEAYKKKYETRFSLEGYLSLPTMFGLASETFGLDLKQNPEDSSRIVAYFKLGTGKNQLKTPPDKYTPDDLEVTDVNGEKAGRTTKVRVHGRRSVVITVEGDKVQQCYMNVDRVEIVK
ncbi:MAG: hypothetical protein OHK0053_26590 [Microscillaceae bacterium]